MHNMERPQTVAATHPITLLATEAARYGAGHFRACLRVRHSGVESLNDDHDVQRQTSGAITLVTAFT
jgi:hypothetical protein